MTRWRPARADKWERAGLRDSVVGPGGTCRWTTTTPVGPRHVGSRRKTVPAAAAVSRVPR